MESILICLLLKELCSQAAILCQTAASNSLKISIYLRSMR
jgi:hypothetical protein